jgi:hypothetical protein
MRQGLAAAMPTACGSSCIVVGDGDGLGLGVGTDKSVGSGSKGGTGGTGLGSSTTGVVDRRGVPTG